MAKRMIAPIDEKNVTSDWIEDVFNCDCVFTQKRSNHRYVGFIADEPVICSYTFGNNVLEWKIMSERQEDAATAKSELLRTLKEIDKENESLVCDYETEGNTIYQSFYFAEETTL